MKQVAGRVRSLREALGLSQEALAARAGLERNEVSKVERGLNQATSWSMRRALGLGFGLSLEDVEQLLEGDVAIATLQLRCAVPAPEQQTS